MRHVMHNCLFLISELMKLSRNRNKIIFFINPELIFCVATLPVPWDAGESDGDLVLAAIAGDRHGGRRGTEEDVQDGGGYLGLIDG